MIALAPALMQLVVSYDCVAQVVCSQKSTEVLYIQGMMGSSVLFAVQPCTVHLSRILELVWLRVVGGR